MSEFPSNLSEFLDKYPDTQDGLARWINDIIVESPTWLGEYRNRVARQILDNLPRLHEQSLDTLIRLATEKAHAAGMRIELVAESMEAAPDLAWDGFKDGTWTAIYKGKYVANCVPNQDGTVLVHIHDCEEQVAQSMDEAREFVRRAFLPYSKWKKEGLVGGGEPPQFTIEGLCGTKFQIFSNGVPMVECDTRDFQPKQPQPTDRIAAIEARLAALSKTVNEHDELWRVRNDEMLSVAERWEKINAMLESSPAPAQPRTYPVVEWVRKTDRQLASINGIQIGEVWDDGTWRLGIEHPFSENGNVESAKHALESKFREWWDELHPQQS